MQLQFCHGTVFRSSRFGDATGLWWLGWHDVLVILFILTNIGSHFTVSHMESDSDFPILTSRNWQVASEWSLVGL